MWAWHQIGQGFPSHFGPPSRCMSVHHEPRLHECTNPCVQLYMYVVHKSIIEGSIDHSSGQDRIRTFLRCVKFICIAGAYLHGVWWGRFAGSLKLLVQICTCALCHVWLLVCMASRCTYICVRICRLARLPLNTSCYQACYMCSRPTYGACS